MNLIDRVVNVFDPIKGAQRLRARAAIQATEMWTGASTSKRTLRNFIPKLTGADEENEKGGGTVSPRNLTMARARQLTRSNPIAGGALKTMVTNIVGSGLSLQLRVDYDQLGWTETRGLKWSEDVEARFDAWARSKNCDMRRTQNFYAQTKVFTRHFLRDGEGFFQMPMVRTNGQNQFALQMIDPARVSNPDGKANVLYGNNRIVSGVETDGYGCPVRYHVERKAANNRSIWEPHEAFDAKGRRQFFHAFDPQYCDETRGMSIFAGVIDQFHMLDKYTDAELTAAVVSSYFTVFVQSKGGAQLPVVDFDSEDGPSSGDEDEIKLGPGAVVEMDGDTTITSANPGRPNDKFDPFVEAILRQIGVYLGLPFEMLIKHFRSSYSAARAALLDGWKYLMTLREFVSEEFCQVVFERWLEYEIAAGRIKAPGFMEDPLKRAAYVRTAWIGDGPGSLDPVKEATARKIDLENGVIDLDEACMAATGEGYMEKHAKMVKIAALRRDAGMTFPGEPKAVPSAPEANTDTKADTKADPSGDAPTPTTDKPTPK